MQVDRTQQRAITRLCIQCGLFLLQHGAESALVEELSTRLGLALGMDSVESAISSNAIVLTTIKNGECLTSTRKNVDRGINMHVVTEVQHIVILAEHKPAGLSRRREAFCADRSPALSALAAGADGGSFLRLFLQTE
ncbi:membrane protein [Klebsiella pneumoniae]|uniref:Membrane protein n=1 Tax=Klebsiella pneumoniae TaxID=573 RepID=A0A2X3DDR8_KLEPN|nr:membrane protein [Klebsiella pneumoniae]